jgi:hypothetical protein
VLGLLLGRDERGLVLDVAQDDVSPQLEQQVGVAVLAVDALTNSRRPLAVRTTNGADPRASAWTAATVTGPNPTVSSTRATRPAVTPRAGAPTAMCQAAPIIQPRATPPRTSSGRCEPT